MKPEVDLFDTWGTGTNRLEIWACKRQILAFLGAYDCAWLPIVYRHCPRSLAGINQHTCPSTTTSWSSCWL